MFEYFWEICGENSSYFAIQQACRVSYKRPKWIYQNISLVLFKIRIFKQTFLKFKKHILFDV